MVGEKSSEQMMDGICLIAVCAIKERKCPTKRLPLSLLGPPAKLCKVPAHAMRAQAQPLSTIPFEEESRAVLIRLVVREVRQGV